MADRADAGAGLGSRGRDGSVTAVAERPRWTTPDGGAVYVQELPPLSGIEFVNATLFDSEGNEVADFPSIGMGHLALIARSLGWIENLGSPS